MATINIHEAKTHFSKLVNRAHAGEEIIVAKAGKPYARLMPLQDPEPRIPGRYPLTIPDSFFADLPESELRAWET